MNYEQARFNMIEQQIRPWDVLDQAVLDTLQSLKRENFVPQHHRALAFSDTEIALTAAGVPRGEVMLAPKVEARILQELAVTKADSVLEIGAGSGFMAALLGKQANQVVSLEINPTLVDFAKANVAKAGLRNVDIRQADGSRLFEQSAGESHTFDVIVLSGSIAVMDESLLARLNPGGRVAAFVGKSPVMQAQLLRKADDGSVTKTILFETDIARLQGFAPVSSFVF